MRVISQINSDFGDCATLTVREQNSNIKYLQKYHQNTLFYKNIDTENELLIYSNPKRAFEIDGVDSNIVCRE